MTAIQSKATKRRRKKKQIRNDLFTQLIRMTGIPGCTIRKELKGIIERKGINPNELTLDQLRQVVASYLREIMGSILDRHHRDVVN
jgi:hypothetical protein